MKSYEYITTWGLLAVLFVAVTIQYMFPDSIMAKPLINLIMEAW